jgi:hypothetical protein
VYMGSKFPWAFSLLGGIWTFLCGPSNLAGPILNSYSPIPMIDLFNYLDIENLFCIGDRSYLCPLMSRAQFQMSCASRNHNCWGA